MPDDKCPKCGAESPDSYWMCGSNISKKGTFHRSRRCRIRELELLLRGYLDELTDMRMRYVKIARSLAAAPSRHPRPNVRGWWVFEMGAGEQWVNFTDTKPLDAVACYGPLPFPPPALAKEQGCSPPSAPQS